MRTDFVEHSAEVHDSADLGGGTAKTGVFHLQN
jgi:hypothetical protein